MATATETIESLAQREYEAGFVTDIEEETIRPGLDEEIVRLISSKKGEPEWLLDWRLKAFRKWREMTEPTWANVSYPPIDYQTLHLLRRATKSRGRSQEPGRGGSRDPQDLREAGHSSSRSRKRWPGWQWTRFSTAFRWPPLFKEKLEELGIIFCSFSEAVKNHPDLIRKYLGSRGAAARTTSSPP